MPARNIMKMKRELHAKAAEARALIDAAEQRADKALTSEEQTKVQDILNECDRREQEIKTEERLQAIDAGSTRNDPENPEGNKNEIREMGEFVQEIVFNPSSSRLATRESRTVTAGSGSSMGFLIPDQPLKSLKEFVAQASIFRPRALVLPAGDPPDGAVPLVGLDQSGALGVYSGLVMRWLGDEIGVRQNAGDPRARMIKVEPQEVSGYVDVSEKALRNSALIGEMISRLLRNATVGFEDRAFLRGDGNAKPLGVIGHPSAITVRRGAPNTITYQDVVNMSASRLYEGEYVWITSQTTLPQLKTMVDAAGNLIWSSSAREGEPNRLDGIPVIVNSRSPVLGREGDLILVNLSYYAIKDGSPMAMFYDPYTQKVNGIVRIYCFWNVDGQPMLTSPLLQEDGESQVSPFVQLV
jgi:HK97 family phage major capsid protein